MNILLRSVLENYVDTLTEREFDVPLLCLLLYSGFYDIHYLHGMFEFGKDFIAKKNENGIATQYVFQSKAGNIDLNGWRDLQAQINEMRINYLAHPNYDKSLPLAAIAVVTGRLIGGAALSAQQYNEYCISRSEVGFTVWDKDILIEMILETDPVICKQPKNGEFLEIIGILSKGNGTFNELEKYSRNWMKVDTVGLINKDCLGILLESSLLCHELLKRNRVTLACYTTLMALRAIMFAIHNTDKMPDWADQILHLTKINFMKLANRLKDSMVLFMPSPKLYEHMKGFSGFITYPILCQQTIEILGLLALLQYKTGELSDASDTTDLVETIIKCNPGCSHLISDKFAISLIPPVLSLWIFKRTDTCKTFLYDVGKWLCDRYEDSEFGLASPESDEQEEIERLFGYAYDFISLNRRKESYIATILLDLSIITNMSELYDALINDILAIRIFPCLVVMKNDIHQYLKDGEALFNPNITYPEKWDDLSNELPPHHKEDVGLFDQSGYDWEAIALYSVLRDRYRVSEIYKIIS